MSNSNLFHEHVKMAKGWWAPYLEKMNQSVTVVNSSN